MLYPVYDFLIINKIPKIRQRHVLVYTMDCESVMQLCLAWFVYMHTKS